LPVALGIDVQPGDFVVVERDETSHGPVYLGDPELAIEKALRLSGLSKSQERLDTG
jgi:hypothetical protein